MTYLDLECNKKYNNIIKKLELIFYITGSSIS